MLRYVTQFRNILTSPDCLHVFQMLFNVTLCPAPAMASLKLIAAAERGEKVGKKVREIWLE